MHLVTFFNHLKSYNEQSMASHLRRAASGWESLGDKLFLCLSRNKFPEMSHYLSMKWNNFLRKREIIMSVGDFCWRNLHSERWLKGKNSHFILILQQDQQVNIRVIGFFWVGHAFKKQKINQRQILALSCHLLITQLTRRNRVCPLC